MIDPAGNEPATQSEAEEPETEGSETEGPGATSSSPSGIDVEVGRGLPDAPQFLFAEDPETALPPPLPPRRVALDWPSFRTPNFIDACLFGMAMILGFLVATSAVGIALYFHWFHLRNFDDVQNSTGVALASQALVYVVGLGAAIPFFRAVWGRGFFDGIHWHGATAFRFRYRLVWTAVGCNVIAFVGNALLPFPQHAPIDKLFGSATDAWMLMAFGVTVAPFFEEMIFRGFLMPAMATAWDWMVERSSGVLPRPLDAQGNPVWSLPAMVFAALTASVPFAFMHSAQVGQAWGPLLLLYCVSLILCAVRLATKSLAASTVVHSAYNFMLFGMMLWETGGFRHLDKM